MTGSKQFVIGPKDIVRGFASSTDTDDGEFSPLTSFGMNLTYKPGVIFGAATTTNTTHPSTGLPIASCGDSINGFYRVVLADNGKVFTSSVSGALTERSDSSLTYEQGVSDIVQYKGYTYISSTTDVSQITGATFATINEDWWSADVTTATALTAGVPHPMLVYEDQLWIANGNQLHRFDGTTQTTLGSEGFLTLPSGQVIVALGIDPQSGLMLISITEGANLAGTLSMLAKVATYDGYSNKPRRVVIVDDMVTAFAPLGGIVYVPYGKNFGYWNGSGITWMRKFKNVALTQVSLVYKHKIAVIDQTMYFVDGSAVYAYGEVESGKSKVFYQAIQNTQGTVMAMIAYIGSGKLILSSGNTAAPVAWLFDSTSVATTDATNFYSRKYRFKGKVRLRSLVFLYNGGVATTATAAAVYAVDAGGTHQMSSLINTETSTVYELESLPIDTLPASKYIQFQYQGGIVNYGIEQITVSYDELE